MIFSHLSSDNISGDCPICLESLQGTNILAHQDGGDHHPFHEICLHTFVNQSRRRDGAIFCPIDRREIVEVPPLRLELNHENLTQMAVVDVNHAMQFLNQAVESDEEFQNFFTNPLRRAVRDQNIEAVRRELANNEPRNHQRLGLLQVAVRDGNIEIVQILLENFELPSELKDSLMRIAKDMNRFDILEQLFANLGETSQYARSIIFEKAMDLGRLNQAENILNSGPVNEEFRIQAVYKAAELNQISLLQKLLSTFSHDMQMIQMRNFAFVAAFERGNIEAVNLLIQDGPIAEQIRNLFIQKCLDENLPGLFNATLQMLVNSPHIVKHLLLRIIGEKRPVELLQVMIQKFNSETFFHEALDLAVDCENREAVQLLRNHLRSKQNSSIDRPNKRRR